MRARDYRRSSAALACLLILSGGACSPRSQFAAQARSLPDESKIVVDTTRGQCAVTRTDLADIGLRYKICWEGAEADKRASRRQYAELVRYYASAGGDRAR